MRTILLCLIAGFSLASLHADQTGAEATKKPVSAAIVDVRKLPDWSGDPIGNVEVTYEDKSKDHWTKLATAMMPKVAADGVVGWGDCGKKGTNELLTNDRGTPVGSRLVLCDHGKVTVRISSAMAFIEEWAFEADGKHVVVKSRAAHGPATVQRFLRADGSAVGEVKAFEEKMPEWAKPYKE
ncbi:hypothetical protein KBB96_01000 [Luteolibacter ambystomatis]|uniref:Uncharacterized protein n=1 Tax=Luteolibacter ambystomatis TaxID=2824561 RepID=A0A975GA98_9BACT|nr:hypothetical protein [Luteolibacter ambystomatis]QUE51490.1 hypothetical protein KBB96_01000 [Luteolibacter ambystomatis]